MTSWKAVLSLAVLLIASVPLALAQGTYTQIDVPGATATNANGIDVAGHITGIYVDSRNRAHGFLLNAGVYTTIDCPGASDTYLLNINNKGQVVGWTVGAVANTGFVYSIPAQQFTEITYPGALYTFPTAINDAGVVGGAFQLNGDELGFALIGSTYKHVGLNGSPYNWVMGITDSNEFVGPMNAGGVNTNFIFAQGKYREFNFQGTSGSVVTGISPDGRAIVGYGASGLLYQNKVLTTLQFPGSTATYPVGINISGEVIGSFFDSSGVQHGFTWTPPADAGKK